MSTIYKYELKVTDHQIVQMPLGATILSVQEQNEKLCLWAEGDPTNPAQDRHIEVIGTGNPIKLKSAQRKFIGTVVMPSFVRHVFERVDV